MPYLPPEGFTPYPGSHLYYRSANGFDPDTGAPCQLVTYFDPQQGTYQQVTYPLPGQTAQPAAAPPRKKRGGLIAALIIAVVLVGGGLTLWLTGAYTKLPFFREKEPAAQTDAQTPEPEIAKPEADKPQPSKPSPAMSQPKQGTPERAALLALGVMLGADQDAAFLDLRGQEIAQAAEQYEDAARDQLTRLAELLPMALADLPVGDNDDLATDMLLPVLRACAAQPQILVQATSQTKRQAVVRVTCKSRLDLDRIGPFLAKLDYGKPFEQLLDQQFDLTVADLNRMDEETVLTCIYAYWVQAISESFETKLCDTKKTTLDVTLVPNDDGNWVLDSIPSDLPQLTFSYTDIPLDWSDAINAAMAAIGAQAPVADAPAVAPGDYTFSLPDFGEVVLLTLYDDDSFYLETALGGDYYYAVGDYEVADSYLLLAPDGDYVLEVMGNLSACTFSIGADGSLTLLSPDKLCQMEAGKKLTPAANS